MLYFLFLGSGDNHDRKNTGLLEERTMRLRMEMEPICSRGRASFLLAAAMTPPVGLMFISFPAPPLKPAVISQLVPRQHPDVPVPGLYNTFFPELPAHFCDLCPGGIDAGCDLLLGQLDHLPFLIAGGVYKKIEKISKSGQGLWPAFSLEYPC